MIRQYTILVLLSSLFLIYGCNPKTAEKIPETVAPVEEEQDESPKERLTPCLTFDDISNREDIEIAFVLYRDQMKLKNIEDAYPIWQMAMHGAPGSNGRVQYHFEDGLRMFKHFYDSTSIPEEKERLVDSIEWVYNKRAECFGDEAYLKGRLAFDYYYYYNEYASQDTIYSLFKEAIDGKGEKTDYFVVNPFVKLLSERFRDSLISMEEAQHYATELLDIIEYGSSNCEGRECEAWEIITAYAPTLLENFEGSKGFYDCSYYSKKYYSLFLENPDDCEVINKSYRRMRWGDCEENLPELLEIKGVKDSACYVPPPAPGPLKAAFIAYNEGNYRKAIDNFKEFISNTDDPDLKAKYYLLISKIYYSDIRNFPESRKYALRAAEHRSNWGEPYMLIGKLYASSGPICGPGRGWDSQIVTWAAIDKFKYARQIDPSISSEANKLINDYSRYMPSIEDIFLRTLKVGDPFTVPCWIQEKTIIRAAKK